MTIKREISFCRVRRKSLIISLIASFILAFFLYLSFLQFNELSDNRLKNSLNVHNQDQESTVFGRGDDGVTRKKLKRKETENSTPDKLNSYEFFSEQNILLNNRNLVGKDKLFSDIDENDGGNEGPTLWVITPTYYRNEIYAELTRVAQALLPNRKFIHWILVYDRSRGNTETIKDLQKFLERFPLSFTILLSESSKGQKIIGNPRGVGGRKAGIAFLRKNHKEGVVYFADDDNTYDSDIFRQMRWTKKVSMWPVGLVTVLGVSSPIVRDGKVIGFYDGWKAKRIFPVDMAGFSINLKLFYEKENANMPFHAGYEEDELLKSLGVKMEDIEPLANNCTEVLTWHTKSIKYLWPIRDKKIKPSTYLTTNLKNLLTKLPLKNLAFSQKPTEKSHDFSFFELLFGSS